MEQEKKILPERPEPRRDVELVKPQRDESTIRRLARLTSPRGRDEERERRDRSEMHAVRL